MSRIDAVLNIAQILALLWIAYSLWWLNRQCNRLRKDNAQLREDKERLDTLDANGIAMTDYFDATPKLTWGVTGTYRDVRQAIDAELRE